MLNLAEYQTKPRRLSDYLPWACLVERGVVLNKDGSLQRTIRFRGPDLESATTSELVAVTSRLNNVLRRFGSGWALFFEAERFASRDYPKSDFPDAASWLVDEERRSAFETQGAHHESRYFLTLLFLPPADAANRAERALFVREADSPSADFRDHLESFISQSDRAVDLLSNILPEVRLLTDAETLTYLHRTVSTKTHPVSVPDTPAHLDAILTDEPLIGGLSPMLGNSHIQTISVLGFPNASEPGLLDELNALSFSYRWMTRWIALDKAEATKVLTRLRRQWFAKRKSVTAILREVMFNQESVLLDSDAGNQALDADDALQELGAGDVAFGYLTTTVTVAHNDATIAAERIGAVERVINGRGFVTIRETLNAVEAWLGSLPGNPYANIRQPLVHTLNLAHMIPASAVWAGPVRNAHLGGPPLVVTRTRGSTPFRLSLHVGDVGHSFIVGPTGSGKSVLLALIALQYRRYRGTQVFVFDKGRSARAALIAMQGKSFDLALDGDLSFQPLARIDLAEECAFALDWVLGLLTTENVQITPEAKDLVWAALNSLAGAPESERTLTGLCVLLQSNKLKQALQPYTLEGPYGRLLDADVDRMPQSPVQHFELEELMHHPNLVQPVLTYLFHRLEARFDGAPSLLIIDEAWVFLDNPMFAGRIREWLKTLRKKNVSVVFATQSLADIAASSIAPALIESCPSRIFLPNDRAIERQSRETYERFGLNDRQIGLISRATPKHDYYYQSARGNRLFELGLGEIALAFCGSSSPDDQKLIDSILSDHGTDRFASTFLRAKGLDWAVDLIPSFPGHSTPREEKS